MASVTYRLGDIARRIDARLVGDPELIVTGLGSLEDAEPGELSHLSSPRYRRFLATTRASAVILSATDSRACPTAALVVGKPYLAFARASRLFASAPALACGVHETAVVAASARLGASVSIGPRAVVGERVEIGDGAAIGANTVVGADCRIGEHTQLHASVTIYHGVAIGPRCVIHSGAVIGADGFGFTPDERGALVAIEQVGSVVIGADVRIGANTAIDRGAISDTVIGDGVKIDNLVQVGHNCVIGEHTVICGCCGLSGSTRIGRHCVLAGGVGIGGDGPIEICDRVVVSGVTHVSSSIAVPGVYSGGVLHSESRAWKRNAIRFGSLDAIAKRVKALEQADAARRARKAKSKRAPR